MYDRSVFCDDNFAYKSHVKESSVLSGKCNTQRIERKHLSLRTGCSHLARKDPFFKVRNHASYYC
ncbi:MAG: IS1 family transposase [Nitrososphaerota archaeon]|nr:IS1 family transposase [Nitrososphaerota archaeon]